MNIYAEASNWRSYIFAPLCINEIALNLLGTETILSVTLSTGNIIDLVEV